MLYTTVYEHPTAPIAVAIATHKTIRATMPVQGREGQMDLMDRGTPAIKLRPGGWGPA